MNTRFSDTHMRDGSLTQVTDELAARLTEGQGEAPEEPLHS